MVVATSAGCATTPAGGDTNVGTIVDLVAATDIPPYADDECVGEAVANGSKQRVVIVQFGAGLRRRYRAFAVAEDVPWAVDQAVSNRVGTCDLASAAG